MQKVKMRLIKLIFAYRYSREEIIDKIGKIPNKANTADARCRVAYYGFSVLKRYLQNKSS